MAFSVRKIEGITYGQYRREVVFLACDTDQEVDALTFYLALRLPDQNRMRDKFEQWARGNNGPSHWFHGFDDEGRRYCFVFKRRRGHTHYRYYGFLFNPRPNTDAGFRVCVLTNHAQKNTEETDPRETAITNALRANAEVIAAIRREYPDRTGGRYATLYRR